MRTQVAIIGGGIVGLATALEVPVDLPVADLAAWTAVARAVLNLHETITRP